MKDLSRKDHSGLAKFSRFLGVGLFSAVVGFLLFLLFLASSVFIICSLMSWFSLRGSGLVLNCNEGGRLEPKRPAPPLVGTF